MPQYRHKCETCGLEIIDLFKLDDASPVHCGSSMRRMMPRRVHGWVAGLPRSVSVSEANEALAGAQATYMKSITKPVDANDPFAMPTSGKWSKDYADCSAAERDDRWRDTHEAMTAWTTRCLENDGVSREQAETQAKALHKDTVDRARTQNERLDGLS